MSDSTAASEVERGAWNACVNPRTGVIVSGVQHFREELAQIVIAGKTWEFIAWASQQQSRTFLAQAEKHFSRTHQRGCTNNIVEEAIYAVHDSLRIVLIFLEDLEHALDLQHCEARQDFALAVGASLQNLHPPPNAVESLLRAQYALFDINTPRGGVSLKHSREDPLCLALADLAGGRAVQGALTAVVFGRVNQLINQGDAILNEAILPASIRKVEHAILPWLYTVAAASGRGAAVARRMPKDGGVSFTPDHIRRSEVARWRMQLMFYLHETVASVRTRQILRIVEQWPSSRPAVDDIKDCLVATDFQAEFVHALQRQFTTELLNAGVETARIVQQYVNLIRLLRVLDPTGIILENVSGPIRTCLRNRPDTIRCIVNGMSVDGDLYAELELEPGVGVDDDLISIDGDYDINGNVDVEAYEAWTPEPRDAPSKESGWRPGGDAIATLVNIYGSSNLLVTEYRTLLADRLINSVDVDLAKEKQVLKLLSDRFGEEAMQECMIMLLDMDASEEIAAGVRDENFETRVISKEFWPQVNGAAEFKPPKQFERHMSVLESTFEQVKKPRKLLWQHGLGVASVRCTFEDGRVVSLTLTPLQAAICLAFGTQSSWSVNELEEHMGVENRTHIVKALVALAGKGVVRAVGDDHYETVERGADAQDQKEEAEDGADADADAVYDEDEEKNMQVFEVYIMGLLQNLKEAPLEKMHSMLKMFVRTPVYDRTQDQLAAFLKRLVSEGKIEVQAGVFKFKAK